jgi:hypothetical protein
MSVIGAPPIWTWVEGREDKSPKGEIGILKAVLLSGTPSNRCLLLMFYEGSFYKGTLLFYDNTFLKHIGELSTSNTAAEVESDDTRTSNPRSASNRKKSQ